MTSALQDIAEHLATDFRDAVIEVEAQDVATIETIIKEFNNAYTDYSNKEALLNTKQEQSLRTLQEISDLRDVNVTSYNRKVETLRAQLAEFRETKLAAKKDAPNVVRLENKA